MPVFRNANLLTYQEQKQMESGWGHTSPYNDPTCQHCNYITRKSNLKYCNVNYYEDCLKAKINIRPEPTEFWSYPNVK